MDLYFHRDSIFHISAEVGGWTCGPLLGCESAYDKSLNGRATRTVSGVLESLAYPLIAFGFGVGAFVLWRRRRSDRAERKLRAFKLGGALFVFSVLVVVDVVVVLVVDILHRSRPAVLDQIVRRPMAAPVTTGALAGVALVALLVFSGSGTQQFIYFQF